ncbi:hypothetical protein L3Q82_017852, partial [Scortum barcoo]
MGLHYILQHLDSPGTYASKDPCLWTVEFSVQYHHPRYPPSKLSQLTVPAPTCQWISNFLTDRRQQWISEGAPSNTASPFHSQQHGVCCGNFQVPGFPQSSQDLKWESNIDAIRKKALHQLRKPSFSLSFAHPSLCGVDQPPNRRKEQTTTDSQDCRKENHHRCQPALHSGLVRVQSQETG